MSTAIRTQNIAQSSDHARFTRAWLEPRFVVITLIALLASLAADRLGAPALLILLLNLTAYAAGGFFGTVQVLESFGVLKTAHTHTQAHGCCAPDEQGKPKLNVDLLMLLAALGAALINQWHEGAMLLFLFSLSHVLQEYAIGRSRKAIRGLFKLYPTEAKVRRDNERIDVIPLDAIRVGDVVLIEPGERIPVDGQVRAGHSTVDQAAITGESIPVEKQPGDGVFAGTLNQQGALDIEARQPASDTVLARIIQMVEDAQDSKAPTERFLERFEQVYAGVILVSVGLFIVIPPALGLTTFAANFYTAMVLMTVASPCALVISTPASFISAIASAARSGVLFKGGAYLEGLAAVKAVAFDKTGTLTTGKPTLTDLVPSAGIDEAHLLQQAASVETRSEHPLAKAVASAAAQRGLALDPVDDFESVIGRGVNGMIGGQRIEVGSPRYLAQVSDLPPDLDAARRRLEDEGKTVMGVRRGETWLGLIALADQVRPEAARAVAALKASGVKVAMLTGDNANVAALIGRAAGVDDIRANLLPEDKVTAITDIQNTYGATAMIGDGVNDAPALANASIGIAMGAAGSDVALEAADVVLMGDRLELIAYAVRLSKKARRVVWQNIGFSLFVIAALLASTFVLQLSLPIGVFGHEGSTLIVVLNGLIQLLLLPEIARRRSVSPLWGG